LLAFNRVFLTAGVAFLLVLPLLAFLRTPEEASVGRHEKVNLHLDA
jgi:hypothetical protein